MAKIPNNIEQKKVGVYRVGYDKNGWPVRIFGEHGNYRVMSGGRETQKDICKLYNTLEEVGDFLLNFDSIR